MSKLKTVRVNVDWLSVVEKSIPIVLVHLIAILELTGFYMLVLWKRLGKWFNVVLFFLLIVALNLHNLSMCFPFELEVPANPPHEN